MGDRSATCAPGRSGGAPSGRAGRGRRHNGGARAASRLSPAAALAAGAALGLTLTAAAPRAARADTAGNTGGQFFAPGVFFEFGLASGTSGIGGEVVGSSLVAPTWGVIANQYIGVAVGSNATYSVTIGTTTFTHNVPGMISFGNVVPNVRFNPGLQGGGSLLTPFDDGMPLNGSGFLDLSYMSGGLPDGAGVWPLASYWSGATEEEFDYPSYLRAVVDGTQTNIVGGGTTTGNGGGGTVLPPELRTNNGYSALTSIYSVPAGTTGGTGGGTGGTGGGATNAVLIQQEIVPVRATAKIIWTIVNNDTVAHNVSLRWATHVRGGTLVSDPNNPNDTTNLYPHGGFFFADPRDGVTFNTRTYPDQEPIPSQLSFYGKRYEPGGTLADAPFASRFTFFSNAAANTGFTPTPPNRVYVCDSKEMFPGDGGFNPGENTNHYEPKYTFGVAVAVYYGPYSIPAGQSRQVIAYYGNGTATEVIDNGTQVTGLSAVVATEATESLQYNAAAAGNLPGSAAGVNLSDLAASFLQPSSFDIYGDLYNLTVRDPKLGVTLPNVKMTLSLPTGLELVSGPSNTQTLQQTPQPGDAGSSPGTIGPDSDGIVHWTVRPNGQAYGPLVYGFNVSATGALAFNRSLSRVVNVPAVPVKTLTSKGFQMIGFPFQFDPAISNNGDPSTIINGSRFSQGPADSNVTFYQWVPDLVNGAAPYYGSYQKATQVVPGQAYFYRSNVAADPNTGTRTVLLEGARPIPYTTSPDPFYPVDVSKGKFTRDLKAGWNMISSPYLYPVALGSLQFAPANNRLQLFTLTDAIATGLVKGGLFFFDTETQQSDLLSDPLATIDPYQGYWIWANQDLQLSFNNPTVHNSAIVPSNNGTEPATRAVKQKGAIASGRAFPAHPNLQNWKLQLVARRGDLVDGTNLFGVSRTGTDGNGKSIVNLPKPPMMSFGPYVYAGLLSTQNDAAAGVGSAAAGRAAGAAASDNGLHYAQLMRSAAAGVKTWDFDVTADSDGPVTLSVPNLPSLPRRVQLKLVDAATGRVTSLRTASSVTVNVRGGKLSRFRLVAQPVASRPLAISGLQVLSGARAGASGRSAAGAGSAYTFAFTLSRDAAVTGRVSTLTGKVLQSFATGRAAAVGENRFTWDGKSSDGGGLPVGTYRLELSARDDDGNVVRLLRPFVVAR